MITVKSLSRLLAHNHSGSGSGGGTGKENDNDEGRYK
jgi:hypothetical protein